MAFSRGPKIVTDGLVLALDAANTKSYPGSGTTWTDLSGNGLDVTLYNSPTYSSGYLQFDGVNDYGSCTLTGINFDSTGFTLEQYLMLLDEPGAWRTTFNIKNSANNNHIDIRNINGAGSMRMNYYPGSPDVFTSATTISENVWYHLVGTWDGATLRFYANGSEIGSGTALASLSLGTSPILNIGRAYSNDRYVNDRFEIIKIHSKALTSSEILQNYNATKGRFGL